MKCSFILKSWRNTSFSSWLTTPDYSIPQFQKANSYQLSVVLMLLVTGCVAPNPQEQARAIQNHSYWSQWAANKHRAIKTFGQPDDTSYMRRYERGYRTVVLTWFDLKTPDGKEWSKVSLPFYNYAPDFELHETSFVGMLPQIPK